MSSSSSSSSGTLGRRRAHSPVAKKKMVIKPFKVQPTPPVDFEARTLAKLQEAVEAVYSMKTFDMSQEELYRAVESLCIHKKAPVLYENLYRQVSSHIQAIIEQLHQSLASSTTTSSSSSSASSSTSTFLSSFEHIWLQHIQQFLTIRSIFLYLDRTYIVQHQLNQLHQNHANKGTQQSNTYSLLLDEDPNTKGTIQPKNLWEVGLYLMAKQIKGRCMPVVTLYCSSSVNIFLPFLM